MPAGSYRRKEIVGSAARTQITSAISASDMSIPIASGTGWPTGASWPFEVVIDRGLATEEQLLITSRAATVLNVHTRGYNDTTAYDHADDAFIEHVVGASTVDQVNRYANEQMAKGDLMAHNGTNAVRLAAPSLANPTNNNKVPLLDNAAAGGWTIGYLPVLYKQPTAPAVGGAQRLWYDETLDLLRPSDGGAWLLPANVYRFVDAAARTATVGGDPPAGTATIVGTGEAAYLEVYDGTAWIRFSRSDEAIPKFANDAARDAFFTSPADGDHAYITGTHQFQERRAAEWIVLNQKVTVAALQPTSPQPGDVWLQPI